MPFFSCIVLSHDKEARVAEAIDSLVAQTFADWEALVFDSGVLYDRGFFATLPAMKDRRFRLIRSWETEEVRQTKTVASWCFNECFRKKLLRGRYVTYLCDDDLLYPGALEGFADYARAHPEAQALYGSVEMTGVNSRGEKFLLREILADEVRGSCCGGGPLDCQVDYLQICHQAALLDAFPDDEYWPEGRDAIRHADGIFLERIGNLVPICPVPVKVGENRKFPGSLNEGGELLEWRLEVCRRDQEIRRLEQALADMRQERNCLRYRVADKLNQAVKRVPALHRVGKKLALAAWQAWRRSK
jgi:glycosyltransferase involved in cell wall biosynthesis